MNIARLINEIKVRVNIANSAKVANHLLQNTQILAKLAPLAVPLDNQIIEELNEAELLSLKVIVNCDSCEHFQTDKIGDGTGIGKCNASIKWTEEFHGRMPLYRYANRSCDKFKKKDFDLLKSSNNK